VDDGVAFWSQGAAQRESVVQLAHLAEVDLAQRIGAANGAFGGLDFAEQQAQEGCFAAAVRSHQADLHARGEDEVEPRE
jgi:hypothetical protein